MSSDVRIIKFKQIIKKIWNNDLDRTLLTYEDKIFLAAIYDYDKLNDYGKAIMEQVSDFTHNRNYLSSYQNVEYRIDLAENVLFYMCFGAGNFYRGYIFIFWALMILAVDDTDKEEHLSVICDFAKLLHINDIAMMDIVQIIRLIFGKETEGFLASTKVKSCFERVLRDFRFQEKPISSLEEGFARLGDIVGGMY